MAAEVTAERALPNKESGRSKGLPTHSSRSESGPSTSSAAYCGKLAST